MEAAARPVLTSWDRSDAAVERDSDWLVIKGLVLVSTCDVIIIV